MSQVNINLKCGVTIASSQSDKNAGTYRKLGLELCPVGSLVKDQDMVNVTHMLVLCKLDCGSETCTTQNVNPNLRNGEIIEGHKYCLGT